MGDSDENSKQAPLVPSWQQAASNQTEDSDTSTESILDQARRFLQEETVKSSSREKKIEFLKSKGLEEADVTKLLEESNETTTQSITQPPTAQPTITTLESIETPASLQEAKPDHPPIVTYPEFLTKPTKPPPLITASGLLNSLTIIGGFSTLVYGATKHLVSPMVSSLTQARVEFHEHANDHLTDLVDKLEQAVSEIPPGYHAAGKSYQHKPLADEDHIHDNDNNSNSSTYDDPTELFHRDVGVQTSAPPSPKPPSSSSYLNPLAAANPRTPAEQTQHQADRLKRLSVGVRGLAADVVHQAEEIEATKGVLDTLGSELHNLTYPPESFGVGSSYLYGASRTEPEDEIKRVKTSIRAMKGVLLSTRNFPASVR
ncbi:hypothetical protein N0V82_006586 [Gnomoniopsis sp. IMI 355080]|nr:hypothetical protein N0V82_006586 [Gnomoniopsis sp. IMI 355080]